MPPARRRPVPSTPTGRPRVAGLRKRPTDPPVVTPPAEPADPTPTTAAPAAVEETDPPRPTEPTEPVEPVEPAESDRPADSTDPDEPEDPDEPAAKPRPTGRRRRDAPLPEPVDAPSPKPRRKPGPEAAEPLPVEVVGEEPTRRGLLLPVSLLVLAAVLVGLGVWFQGRAGDVRYNRALVDSAATTEVSGQVRDAVEKAFSYNFADVSATEKAAADLLVGKAKCQYEAIFEPVRTLAPEQKLVVTVKAVSSGVTSLDDGRATVLLFIDQVTTRTTDNQSGGGIAMMRVGAEKAGDRWKVDNMEMFGSTADQSASLARCG
ncbi:hypothetical protein [Actinosynnema sp. NPDC020468]|uniref:hypothetical protein n=1 Tax=Actinosynnema sp. NPDC020468 TaxID=3154488 RepID=UPI0033FFF475